MSHIATIETKVAGIPCLIGVFSYRKVKGSFTRSAFSDMDYHGYVESEWELLDRKGYKATWLERKMNDQIRDNLEEKISDFFKGE